MKSMHAMVKAGAQGQPPPLPGMPGMPVGAAAGGAFPMPGVGMAPPPEIYVANLPPKTTGPQLQTFLEGAMSQLKIGAKSLWKRKG